MRRLPVNARHPWLAFRMWCRNWFDLRRDQRQATRRDDQW